MLLVGFCRCILVITCHGLIAEYLQSETESFCYPHTWALSFSLRSRGIHLILLLTHFYRLAPLHCPPQGPFPPLVRSRGLTLAFTRLKCKVCFRVAQAGTQGARFSKAFWKRAVLGKPRLAPGPGSRPWRLRSSVYLRIRPREASDWVCIICSSW